MSIRNQLWTWLQSGVPLASLAVIISAMGCALSVPPFRILIEQSMFWHMVIQIPTLVAGGWLLSRSVLGRNSASSLGKWTQDWNRFGLTSFIASQLILAYWTLPLAIDRAVVLPQTDFYKVTSLLACGALTGASFRRSPVVLQLFFVGYAITMSAAAGVFLATTEVRLCNAYLLDAQADAGHGLITLSVILGLWWGWHIKRQANHLTFSGSTGNISNSVREQFQPVIDKGSD